MIKRTNMRFKQSHIAIEIGNPLQNVLFFPVSYDVILKKITFDSKNAIQLNDIPIKLL